MNIKRWIGASVAAFAAYQLVDFPSHTFILGGYYQALAQIWRQDMMSIMWIMFLAMFVMTLLFVYIFARGYEGKGLAEGLRFGVIAGLFYQIPSVLGQYVLYPLPFGLVLAWLALGLVEFTLMGVVAAAIYRK